MAASAAPAASIALMCASRAVTSPLQVTPPHPAAWSVRLLIRTPTFNDQDSQAVRWQLPSARASSEHPCIFRARSTSKISWEGQPGGGVLHGLVHGGPGGGGVSHRRPGGQQRSLECLPGPGHARPAAPDWPWLHTTADADGYVRNCTMAREGVRCELCPSLPWDLN